MDMTSALESAPGLSCLDHTCEHDRIMMAHFALAWHLMYLRMTMMLPPQLDVTKTSVSKIRECVGRASWSQAAAKAAPGSP